MEDEVERWIPTLEAARRAEAGVPVHLLWDRWQLNLLEREPLAVRRLAVILLRARLAAPPHETVLRYPYVPSMPFPLEEGVARVFEQLGPFEPPEELKVELERRPGGSPYRGMPPSVEGFRGFDYGDALPQVRARLASMRAARASEVEVETFAWPVLHLTFRAFFRRQEIALMIRPDGVMHALRHRGGFF